MSKMYRDQQSMEQTTTDQSDMGQGHQNSNFSNGMGNAARLEQMKDNQPRETTLPFRFSESNLSKCGPYIQPINRSFRDVRLGQKDGSWLTDSEKLVLVATTLQAAGATDTKIADMVNGLFFYVKNASHRQLDSVKRVLIAGNKVTVQFRNNNVEGGSAVFPMVFEGAVAHDGRDTNERGNTVAHFQKTVLPLQENSWLQRNSSIILEGFLASKQGLPFAKMNPTARQNDPGFKVAFYNFKTSISHLYLTNGAHVVQKNVEANQKAGDPPAVIRDKAVDDALNYTNKNAYATPHTTLEIQDEAIVQKALQALGIDIDIDTDVQDQRVSMNNKP